MVKPPCTSFRMITANFSGVKIFRNFTVFIIEQSLRADLILSESPVMQRQNELAHEIMVLIT